jgi:hypothetical protein
VGADGFIEHVDEIERHVSSYIAHAIPILRLGDEPLRRFPLALGTVLGDLTRDGGISPTPTHIRHLIPGRPSQHGARELELSIV